MSQNLMNDQKTCPACQRVNSITATSCRYCGTPLDDPSNKYTATTKGVHITPPDHQSQIPSCKELVTQLSDGSLALMVEGANSPIIIHNITSVVLGRGEESPPGVKFINLMELGDLVMGISRHHARITYDGKQYWLEDLHSTNGSWLNRKRLVAGVPYALATNDYLWLGPLKIAICLASASKDVPQPAPAKEITVTLQTRNALILPKQPLSPELLLSHVAPFLTALAQVQEGLDQFRGRTAVPILINVIKEQNESTAVTLSGASEVASLYHTHISLWRDRHLAEFQAGNIAEAALTILLEELAFDIGLVVAPDLNEAAITSWAQTVLPVLQILALSPLDLQPASQSKETRVIHSEP